MATFDEMPTLRTSEPSSPPSSSRHLRKSYARRAERCCCQAFSYIPLCFVYGVTSWAVWVAWNISFFGFKITPIAYVKAAIAIALYILANTSYSVSVFTPPGSPSDERKDHGRNRGPGGRGTYEGLPTHEPHDEEADVGTLPQMTTVTAKSSGSPRFCKKCNCIKPDRTHHCSTCGTCVMKMDHHCPWLATCVGLRNYKAFLLFLMYTSLFCWYCFGLAGFWVWSEIVHESQLEEGFRIVNTILLAVIGGIIGLVLTGFTGWHIYLTLTGQTTIESLEKTRYLSPVKKSMERQINSNRTWLADEDSESRGQSIGDQLKEIHANALPGVLRPEEGESSMRTPDNRSPAPMQNGSPAKERLQKSYAEMEAQRERDRYVAYLDEQDSEKLPNAFNLGWKRNALHVFGHQPLLWFFPVCNTTGDGWQWEISPAWLAARDDVARQREARDRQERFVGPSHRPPPPDFRWQPGQGFVRQGEHVPPPPRANGHTDSREMQPLDRRKGPDDYDTSSDEERPRVRGPTANWNDVPEDFLNTSRSRDTVRSTSQGRLGKGKGD